MAGTVIILKQMVIMFIYMAVGCILFRKKLLSKEASKGLANLLLYVILPSVIIKSFSAADDRQSIGAIAGSVLLGVAILLLAMVVAAVLFRKNPIDNFGAAFSNAGFMGIPLISALVGPEAVLYTAGMVASLNIFQWFYGQSILAEKKMRVHYKEILSNPLVISFAAGLAMYFFQIKLPELLLTPINALSALNAPIAMIVLGVYLAQTDIKGLFVERRLYYVSFARLFIMPAATFFFLSLFPGMGTEVKMSLLIAAAAPVGSNVAVYAQKLGADYTYAVKTVCLSTLLSIISMPACIWAAGAIWK